MERKDPLRWRNLKSWSLCFFSVKSNYKTADLITINLHFHCVTFEEAIPSPSSVKHSSHSALPPCWNNSGHGALIPPHPQTGLCDPDVSSVSIYYLQERSRRASNDASLGRTTRRLVTDAAAPSPPRLFEVSTFMWHLDYVTVWCNRLDY